MASRKKPARRGAAKRKTSRYVCSDCGFKAAHAMGLGRHRTAIHGVPSQREQAERKSKRSDGARVARLERRVADLEKRYDSLVRGLRRTATGATNR
jgi:uncharacterized protein YceH (UPF0502 family)